ncbi:MAG TPA: bacteriohemerythrin [Bryobacteraceae bacterium]|nr:bacteriohemerythrin [Bryobacteraceae bacterium]
MFEWNDRYSLKIANIDGQHQKLFRLANELHAAMQAGNTESTVEIVERLIQCGTLHFAYEERLMLECGYPGYSAHKAVHDELKRQVLQLQADLQSSNRMLGITILQILRKALISHIEAEDSKYAPYVRVPDSEVVSKR